MTFLNYLEKIGNIKETGFHVFDYIVDVSLSNNDQDTPRVFTFNDQDSNLYNDIPSSINSLLDLVESIPDFKKIFIKKTGFKEGTILEKIDTCSKNFSDMTDLFQNFYNELKKEKILIGYFVVGFPKNISSYKTYIFVTFDEKVSYAEKTLKLQIHSFLNTILQKSKEYKLIGYIYKTSDDNYVFKNHKDCTKNVNTNDIVLCVYKTDAVPFNTGDNTSIVYNSYGTPRIFH